MLALAVTYFMRGGASGDTQPEQVAAGGVVAAAEVATSTPSECLYSIVPGGVYSRDQVRKAAESDAVIAAHYSTVDIESLREGRAAEGRRVFVSYRLRDAVYWSLKRVALEPGEVILTDGRTEIRARCGNLVSDGARLSAGRAASADQSALNNAESNDIETGAADTAATVSDAIVPAPAGSGAIGLPAPDQVLANPGTGGSGSPSTTAPWMFVIPRAQPGGSGAGSPGGGGGGTSGGSGIAGGNLIGGVADTDGGGGSGGGNGSGDVGGGADNDRSGGGNGSSNSGADRGPSGGGSGSGDGGGGNPGNGVGPGGSGSPDGGGSPSSPDSDLGGPSTGNPDGPGTGGPGTDNPAVLIDQSDDTEPTTVRVPEPTTLSLFAIGIGAAALAGRRRTRQR